MSRTRGRFESQQLKQLIDFTAMRAEVNQQVLNANSDQEFVTDLCRIAAQYTQVASAAIVRPGHQGRFEILASSGENNYLKAIRLSIDPDIKEGQGAAGRTWRTAAPHYVQSYDGDPDHQMWRNDAQRYGIKSSAVLPLFRGGSLWGLLLVYHHLENIFNRPLRMILETLASDISNGLDILDLRMQSEHDSAIQSTLLDTTIAGICMVRDRRLVAVNQRLADMMGYAHNDQLIGQSTRMLYQHQSDYDRLGGTYPELMTYGRTSLSAVEFRRQDGTTIICDLAGGRVDEFTSVWTVLDVSERHQLQQQLQYQASHDMLTDLPNRRALERRVEEAIVVADQKHTAFAFGIIDLDDFKPINDQRGHNVGDMVLKEVARRLTSALSPNDFVARLGGDEFVVIFDQLSNDAIVSDLAPRLRGIERTMDAPISLDHKSSAVFGMSMGLSVYPHDGVDGDALLRHADASLYQAKSRKDTRSNWWQWGVLHEESLPHTTVVNPYSQEAKELLKRIRTAISTVADDFVQEFYTTLAQDPAAAAILQSLSSGEAAALKENQRNHIRFLLSSEATREELAKRAWRLGEVHRFVGVTTTVLSHSMQIFRRIMIEKLRTMPEIGRDIFHMIFLVDGLLQDNMQFQLEAGQAIWAAYLDLLSLPTADDGDLWADVSLRELEAIASLPGIMACEMLRPDTDGVFHVEGSAGIVADQMALILAREPYRPTLSELSETSRGLVALAWNNGTIQSTRSYTRDERTRAWHDALTPLGIRSMVAIPVPDRDGRPVLILAIQGGYPNQFEDLQIRQWANALMQRWSSTWHHSTAIAAQPVLPPDISSDYRSRLFSGGFELFMQPIVDMRTGHIVKAEGLARIKMPNGQIVAPDLFVPLLGDMELDRLFRLGLDTALRNLTHWDHFAVPIEVAVNLPPQTLLEAELPMWVSQALRRHHLPPERLTLELLETQRLNQPEQNAALAALLKLGVKLAMDDLGSGYSSLERLAHLPFHIIKFDKALLARMAEDPLQTLALMSSILQMGQDFKQEVVIEGLEDLGLVEAAMVLGAPYGQGYALGRPMPDAEFKLYAASFAFPLSHQSIATPLGALAYHWYHTRTLTVHEAFSLVECPLTPFFADHPLQYQEAMPIHALVHTHSHGGEMPDALTHLLVEQVVQERR